MAIYRKKVHHRATKNFQLDLFDPNDGHYEYSAVTSNMGFTLSNLWYFMCGRGNHEKTIAQLKTGLAFHTVPTMAYGANSAWQQFVALAHNLPHKLPDRYRSCSSQAVPEANRSARSAEHSDFALCAPESCRRTRPPQRRDEAALDEQ